MRFVGLDIGRDFAHVAVVDGSGTARRLSRLAMGDEFRGFISRAGQAHARGLLCEAAHSAVRSPGPLAGFHARLKARRGAGVATARKLTVLVWHLLAKGEDCRFAAEARTAFKHRGLDRLAGRSGARPSQRGATGSSHDQDRARLRGGHDPHDPALRHAIDRVHPDHTSPSGT